MTIRAKPIIFARRVAEINLANPLKTSSSDGEIIVLKAPWGLFRTKGPYFLQSRFDAATFRLISVSPFEQAAGGQWGAGSSPRRENRQLLLPRVGSPPNSKPRRSK